MSHWGPGKAPTWHKLPQTRLPNGLKIRYVSRKDVPFLYREVYEEQNYLQGLSLRHGNTVLDIGANIGLFGLRAAETVGAQVKILDLIQFVQKSPILCPSQA